MVEEELDVGDHLWIGASERFWKIADLRPGRYKYTAALTASQKITNQSIPELNSPTDQVFHVTGVELEHNVHLWLRFRGKSLLGIKASEYIDQTTAVMGNPFPLDQWMYNYTPYADIEEQIGAAYTANIYFSVLIYDIEPVKDENELKRLKREATPYLGYKGVHG